MLFEVIELYHIVDVASITRSYSTLFNVCFEKTQKYLFNERIADHITSVAKILLAQNYLQNMYMVGDLMS